MSLKWPSKDPDETVDFSVDWSRYLGSQATIDTVTWFVNNSSGVTLPPLAHIQSTCCISPLLYETSQ